MKVTVEQINSNLRFGDWLKNNTVYVPPVLSCAMAALVWAGGSRNDSFDAMRHAYWNACITNTVSAEVSAAATSSYEFTNPNVHNEHVMDLENNAIGRNIGGNFPYLIGMTIVQEEIKATARNGALTVMDDASNEKGSGVLVPSN